MFVGLAFLLGPSGYDPHSRSTSVYFHETWINGNFLLTIWNHFRSDIPRTNNNCEGYNSRLAKRAVKSHLNIYELNLLFKSENANKEAHLLQLLIFLFKSENANKEAHLLQLEGGQKPRKSRRTEEGRKDMFYLTTHSTHFIYGYMASDIWLRTILIVRKETRCRHIGYSFRLTARVLLYAPSHRQDSTYHGLCYTSRGALAGTRHS